MRIFNLWITNYRKAQVRLLEMSREAWDADERAIFLAQKNWGLQKENELLKNELASLRLKLAALGADECA